MSKSGVDEGGDALGLDLPKVLGVGFAIGLDAGWPNTRLGLLFGHYT